MLTHGVGVFLVISSVWSTEADGSLYRKPGKPTCKASRVGGCQAGAAVPATADERHAIPHAGLPRTVCHV